MGSKGIKVAIAMSHNTHEPWDGPGAQESVDAFKDIDKQDILGTFSGQTSLQWYGVE